MTQEEAKIIIKNAKPITPIKRSSTVKMTEENNTFNKIMRKWQKK